MHFNSSVVHSLEPVAGPVFFDTKHHIRFLRFTGFRSCPRPAVYLQDSLILLRMVGQKWAADSVSRWSKIKIKHVFGLSLKHTCPGKLVGYPPDHAPGSPRTVPWGFPGSDPWELLNPGTTDCFILLRFPWNPQDVRLMVSSGIPIQLWPLLSFKSKQNEQNNHKRVRYLLKQLTELEQDARWGRFSKNTTTIGFAFCDVDVTWQKSRLNLRKKHEKTVS